MHFGNQEAIMAEPARSNAFQTSPTYQTTQLSAQSPAWQAFRILQAGFVALPIIAGLDKFFDLLAYWPKYLSPFVARFIPAQTFMTVVGVVEIAAGVLVAVKPRVGAYVVALWLLGIVGNLLLTGGYLDIALRDFGLAVGAFALARLSETHPKALLGRT
jgi:hypothetical protein